ncbi:hypothetical protein DFR58_13523 [Anaerobacterium chartisolvens]|uniref:DUF4015 domain-containing protein n=1 Tax=Anaerobacterium chartisolvens TaxID=1297424 RepID=A0A369AJN4_9FIRM|nr:putative glycoside hydrolase [Anaerobacterium chartisolvens]RCX09592.1 hypothetical protein DFR58_13523 [Anaerobacterium chartisolvens]
MKRSAILCIVVLAMTILVFASITGCGKNPGVNQEDIVKNGSTSDNTPQQTTSESNTNSPSEPDKTGENESGGVDNAQKEPRKAVKAKALYLTGWTVGSSDKVQHFINLAKTTEINSYVIDIKDDDGLVGYESNVPAVREINAWKKKYNADKVLKEFHDNGVYIIGRLVCFKDPVLSSEKPELAIKHSKGGLWKDKKDKTWLNPYNKDSWPYLIDIAREAVDKGFDEIQFDYVRFANDGNKKAMVFGNTEKEKYEVINDFLAYARKELPGVVLSADVFGIICESPADTEDIGQYLELVGKDIDYICPMVYPSHYAVGQQVNGVKYAKPDFEPYGVVYNSLAKAKDRIAKVPEYKANVRPYLQDFTATWLGKGYYMSYGAEQVKQQIKAVYDAGYEEWILWDSKNTYSEEAFLKEGN